MKDTLNDGSRNEQRYLQNGSSPVQWQWKFFPQESEKRRLLQGPSYTLKDLGLYEHSFWLHSKTANKNTEITSALFLRGQVSIELFRKHRLVDLLIFNQWMKVISKLGF